MTFQLPGQPRIFPGTSPQKLGLSLESRDGWSLYLCLKTLSGKVVRHLLAYLTMHKWIVGDVPLNVNFVRKDAHRCRCSAGLLKLWTAVHNPDREDVSGGPWQSPNLVQNTT